ncbi:hypothetical protein JAAARDRAFT_38607 [Jaapia argillacea MUCL 33604]|uniref:Aminoglycoside phosphotransferase domain-containing protein n=1 Tax=Jaapia argillacea MUCL 33604 TaxID=933084 RepID=A0A067PGW6_9AGAM|nr:hypothetical protein JAAARDRAFT_38607 [Jaapia argillacea MUCL 33604]
MTDRLEQSLRILNDGIAKLFLNALSDDPTVDLTPVIQKASDKYARIRAEKYQLQAKRQKTSHPGVSEPRHKAPRKAAPKANSAASRLPPGPVAIESPLAPGVMTLLGASEQDILAHPEALRQPFTRLLNEGQVVWSGPDGFDCYVMRLSDDIVVKTRRRLDYDEPALLRFVAAHTSIPVPEPMGILKVGSVAYMFMAFVPGDTLDTRWPTLEQPQKHAIRQQLNQLLLELRGVEHYVGTPLGSLSGSHLCQDTRIDTRLSSGTLYTEAEFNDCLISTPLPRIARGFIQWVRSLLRDDHRIVLTHGDFHPGNIMVVDHPTQGLVVSGLIDWEFGGWYPEQWEMVKAMNTRGTDNESDWWAYLPEVLNQYNADVAVDRLLERSVCTG